MGCSGRSSNLLDLVARSRGPVSSVRGVCRLLGLPAVRLCLACGSCCRCCSPNCCLGLVESPDRTASIRAVIGSFTCDAEPAHAADRGSRPCSRSKTNVTRSHKRESSGPGRRLSRSSGAAPQCHGITRQTSRRAQIGRIADGPTRSLSTTRHLLRGKNCGELPFWRLQPRGQGGCHRFRTKVRELDGG